MNNIYAHPAICATPELIWALQERLGVRAIVEGRRVRLVGEPRPTGRPLGEPPLDLSRLGPTPLVNCNLRCADLHRPPKFWETQPEEDEK